MRNKEQAILEAAEREFIVKGFAGARTTSIAEAAGVTHAMLHYYFRTKEQLFERILDEKMRLMGESVLAAFGQPGFPFIAYPVIEPILGDLTADRERFFARRRAENTEVILRRLKKCDS